MHRFPESSSFMYGFELGRTRWHVDGYPGLADEFEHNYINAWMPLTESNAVNSTLKVLPRSHLDGYRGFPTDRESEARILETAPGDVVILDGKLFHASTQNQTEDSYRFSFSTRYLPFGHRSGKPFLPPFVARSRANPASELTDVCLWANYWTAALEYLDRYELPLTDPFLLSAAEVGRIEARWRELVPTPDSWLSLNSRSS